MRENYSDKINVKLGPVKIKYKTQIPLTKFFFGKYFAEDNDTKLELTVDNDEILQYYQRNEEIRRLADAEIWLLLEKTALSLLDFDSAIFHAVAFKWKGKAWLFTAPSGTGKTTQYLNWKKEFKESVEIINGDKPVVSLNQSGGIWVHGSPWRGKENLGNNISAPLGGIVFLEQGSEDLMTLMPRTEAVIRLFGSFWIPPVTEEQIRVMSRIIDQMITDYPVWKLTNRGDANSVYLAENMFNEYLVQDHEI